MTFVYIHVHVCYAYLQKANIEESINVETAGSSGKMVNMYWYVWVKVLLKLVIRQTH